jgi:hypothetical protein
MAQELIANMLRQTWEAYLYSGLRSYKRNPGGKQIIEQAVRSELCRYYIIDDVQSFSCFSATQQFSSVWTENMLQVDQWVFAPAQTGIGDA